MYKVTELYRYESGHKPEEVELKVFVATKSTLEGWWFIPKYMLNFPDANLVKESTMWVSKSARKRYCYPTKQKAWESYCIRKYWRVKHLERQLKKALAEACYAESGRKADIL